MQLDVDGLRLQFQIALDPKTPLQTAEMVGRTIICSLRDQGVTGLEDLVFRASRGQKQVPEPIDDTPLMPFGKYGPKAMEQGKEQQTIGWVARHDRGYLHYLRDKGIAKGWLRDMIDELCGGMPPERDPRQDDSDDLSFGPA